MKRRIKALLEKCEDHLRPCEVDGKPCLFHRWADEDKAVLEIGPLVKQDTLDV